MKKRKKKQSENELQIAYSGNVTVQLVRNNKVIKTINGHNEGTSRLFKFIADCLANDYSGAYSPKYIQVFNVDSSGQQINDSTESLTGLIAVSTESAVENQTDNDATAKLTFTIPGELFSTGTKLSEINLFCMYSQIGGTHNSNYLARYYIEGGLGDSSTIDRNVNIIIVWELGVGNK